MTHGQAAEYRNATDDDLRSLIEAARQAFNRSPKGASYRERARVRLSVLKEEQARRARLSQHERLYETRGRLLREGLL